MKPLEDPVLELRIYELKPGQRDTLISLFESQFIESQEALGARIVGTFRVPELPDRFVWLRSFRSMAARAVALQAFYTGTTWRANSRAANDTMVSVDDVYLLRPTTKRMRLPEDRPALGSAPPMQATFSVEVFPLALAGEVERCALADPAVLATYVTEQAPNNFAALPVREDRVAVVVRRLGAGSSTSHCGIAPQRHLNLVPTSRSRLR